MSYLFRVNQDKWKNLVALKNWKHPIVELAKRTGFGKSYISQVINGGLNVSHDFMAKYIEVCGASPANVEEWAALFDVVKESVKVQRKPEMWQIDNYPKFRGEKDYAIFSMTGETRKRNAAERLIRLDLPNVIPAYQFYSVMNKTDEGYHGDKDNYWQHKRRFKKK